MNRALPMFVLIFALAFFFISERASFFASYGEKEQPTVMFWAFAMPAKTMLQLRDQFQDRPPYIQVEVQTIAWESMQSKTLWAIAANSNVPDVIVASSEWMGGLASNGALQPLDDLLPPEFFDRYFPATLGIYQFPEVDRDRPAWRGRMRQYGVPLDLDLMMIYYRADVLDPIMQGLGMTEFPRTWAEFQRLGKAVRNYSHDTGQSVHLLYLDPADVVPMSMAFLPASGGSFLDPTLTRAIFDGPEAVAAFDYFHGLIQENIAIPWNRSTMEDPIVLYKSGRALANISGPWYASHLESKAPELAGKWRVAMFPRRSEELPSTGLGGACLAIPYNARHTSEALQLIKFMASDEFAIQYFNRTGSPPPQETAWDHEAFTQASPYFGGQNIYDVVKMAIETARPLQLMPDPEITKGPVRWALGQTAISGEQETETLQRAVRAANRLLRVR